MKYRLYLTNSFGEESFHVDFDTSESAVSYGMLVLDSDSITSFRVEKVEESEISNEANR